MHRNTLQHYASVAHKNIESYFLFCGFISLKVSRTFSGTIICGINKSDITAKKSPKKTTSFRVEPDTLEKLDLASKEDNISLNTLVNQVLASYVSWERPAIKAGWVTIKEEVVKSIIDMLTENEIKRIAVNSAKNVTKDTLLSMTGRYDLRTWLAVTRHRSERSGFHYQESRKDGQIDIIIKHNMGLNWSVFHKWYYNQMLRDLGYSTIIDYTEKTIVIAIKQ